MGADLGRCPACGGTLNATEEARLIASLEAQDCPRCWRWVIAATNKVIMDAINAPGDDSIDDRPIKEFMRKMGKVGEERGREDSMSRTFHLLAPMPIKNPYSFPGDQGPRSWIG